MKGKKILIAGGTGLIGSRIVERLKSKDVSIFILTRKPKPSHDNVTYFSWDVKNQEIDDKAVMVDYIINLTGEGIADKRWTEQRKRLIINSRIDSIRLLKAALTRTQHRPEAIISASAIGYYGDRKDEILTEDSKAGEGFLSDCCVLWEDEAMTLATHTGRLSIIRIGIVLSTLGGALPQILLTSPLRTLHYFGSGKQYYSWIHIDDLCNMIFHILQDQSCSGIFNGVAPTPLPNKDFVKDVARGLNSWYMVLPAPALALQLALGEMAAVVINSNRVIPQMAKKIGFKYEHPSLPDAIRHLSASKI